MEMKTTKITTEKRTLNFFSDAIYKAYEKWDLIKATTNLIVSAQIAITVGIGAINKPKEKQLRV